MATTKLVDLTAALLERQAQIAVTLAALKRIEIFTADIEAQGFGVAVSDPADDAITITIMLASPTLIVVPEPPPPSPPPARADAPQGGAGEADQGGPVGAALVEEDTVGDIALKTGPLDAEERKIILSRTAEGVSRREIAEELHRRVQAIALFLTAHEYSAAEAQRKATTQFKPPAVAEVEAAPPQPTPEPPRTTHRGGPAWAIEIHHRLDRLGNDRVFTPKVDLDLVQRLAKGQKLGWISQDLGIDQPLLKARFGKLVPETGIVAQDRVLTVLRERAEDPAI